MWSIIPTVIEASAIYRVELYHIYVAHCVPERRSNFDGFSTVCIYGSMRANGCELYDAGKYIDESRRCSRLRGRIGNTKHVNNLFNLINNLST